MFRSSTIRWPSWEPIFAPGRSGLRAHSLLRWGCCWFLAARAGLLFISLTALGRASGPVGPRDECMARELSVLPPLSKVHYSWPISDAFLTTQSAALREYARVTGSVSVRGETVTAEQIDALVLACKQAHRGGALEGASIAVNYSPWHRRFGGDLPATDTGPTATAEVEMFRRRLWAVRDALGEANRRHETNVGVSAVILDSERFKISSSNRAINKARTRKYDQIYEVAKEAFPRARVEWYARGLIHKVSEGKWSVVPYFTLQEKGDSVSCQVYEVPSVARMRESCQRTVALAGENGREAVTAWVALGAGFDRSGLRPRWRFNLDYDPAFSWTLGRDINRSLE